MKCVGINFTEPLKKWRKHGNYFGPKGIGKAQRRRIGTIERSMDAEFEKLRKQQRRKI